MLYILLDRICKYQSPKEYVMKDGYGRYDLMRKWEFDETNGVYIDNIKLEDIIVL